MKFPFNPLSVIVMSNEKKNKISAFEFVFMQATDPEKAKEYRPVTREEELKERVDNLKEQASKMKIKES